MPNILLVEDNIMFRETLKLILTSHFPNMEIEEAGDGRTALEKIETRVPELIIMDIKLPHASGLDLTKKIKNNWAKTKIVVVSTYDSLEYEEAASACGADFFISKRTSSLDDIISAIALLLKKTSSEKE